MLLPLNSGARLWLGWMLCLVAVVSSHAAAEDGGSPQPSQIIDQLIAAKADQQQPQLEPAPLVDDSAFLRRVTVDLIGRIPTEAEFAAYWRLDARTRRSQWVDRLLDDPRFADRWTSFFADMLQIRYDANGGGPLDHFVRQSLREAMPYDEMVRRLLTATGSTSSDPAAGFLTSEDAEPMEVAGKVAQSLLGVRMKCAQCHNHPFDDWSQEDYYGLAAYFGKTRIYQRNQETLPRLVETQNPRVLWPPDAPAGKAKPVSPKWPFQVMEPSERLQSISQQYADQRRKAAQDAAVDELIDELANLASDGGRMDMIDRNRLDLQKSIKINQGNPDRYALAQMLTSAGNRYFTWNISNRIWAQLIGYGLVEPIDDFRADNPPSHPELLDYLSQHLIEVGYDLRHLVRAIVLSDAYRRSTLPANHPGRDQLESLFLSARLRRMPAEAIYDSIVIAGNLSQFKHPAGQHMRTRSYTIARRKSEDQLAAAREMQPTKPSASMMAAAKPATTEMMEEEKDLDPEQLGETSSPVTLDPAVAADPLAKQPDPRMDGQPMASMMMAHGPRELNFEQLLSEADSPLGQLNVVEVDFSEILTLEERKRLAAQEEAQRRANPDDYEYETITETYDANPRFGFAVQMPSPAPPEHFLRQFGQPARTTLGDKRDPSASMRQALILMNGKLVNEAARVGSLEPVGLMLQAGAPLDSVIDRIYIDLMTRKPTTEELQAARQYIESAQSLQDGVADWRWVLFNSHEFRFLP